MTELTPIFPHADAAIEAYLKEYKAQSARAERLRAVFHEFLRQEIDNTRIFKSKKYGVQLPYTSIRVAELAKHIYSKYVQSDRVLERNETPNDPVKHEFVFGTAVTLMEGNQFNYVEEAMHQCVKYLPRALEELKEGRVAEDREILTLGMPTNVLGYISPDYAGRLARAPFKELGEVYAELVVQEINKRPPIKRRILELYGMSLGAGLAVCTGERLIELGAVSQSHDFTERRPCLAIRAEVPVTLGPSKIKSLQIPIGFMIDVKIELSKAYVKGIHKSKPLFFNQVNAILAQRGIVKHMSSKQKWLKHKALFNIVAALQRDFEPKLETRITEVYGLKDATTFTIAMASEAKRRKREFAGTLGQNMIGRKRSTSRVFIADMLHLNPRFRLNELRRMNALAFSLEALGTDPA